MKKIQQTRIRGFCAKLSLTTTVFCTVLRICNHLPCGIFGKLLKYVILNIQCFLTFQKQASSIRDLSSLEYCQNI